MAARDRWLLAEDDDALWLLNAKAQKCTDDNKDTPRGVVER